MAFKGLTWETQSHSTTVAHDEIGSDLLEEKPRGGSPEAGRSGGGGEDGQKGIHYLLKLRTPVHHDLLFPLQDKAQKVLQKLGDVQEIFHKRQVSLMKLAAKQTRPVQPVAPHPESSPKWVSPKTSQPSALGRLFGRSNLWGLPEYL